MGQGMTPPPTLPPPLCLFVFHNYCSENFTILPGATLLLKLLGSVSLLVAFAEFSIPNDVLAIFFSLLSCWGWMGPTVSW